MTIRFEKDWERVQKLGLKRGIKTVVDYEAWAIDGLSAAREYAASLPSPFPTLTQIKRLHRIGFSRIHPWAGNFRTQGQEVNIGNIQCTLSTEVPDRLEELQSTMREVYPAKHEPARQLFWLSFYHSAFEMIHPFADGNGRIGRIILGSQIDAVLQDNQRCIMRREDYIEALRTAENTNNPAALAELIISSRLPIRELQPNYNPGMEIVL